MFLIIIPVIVPFFQDLGLSMQEVFIAQSLFGLTVVLFEVPSGYLADIWGRNRTLMVGGLFYGLGFSAMYWAEGLPSILLYEALLGVGIAMISGTDVSLLYDSILASGNEDVNYPRRAMSNAMALKLVGETIASLIGGALVVLSFHWVTFVQLCVSWFPLMVALTMKEPPVERLSTVSHWGNFRQILRETFYEDTLLRLICINLIAYGLATYVMVWMFQAYWEGEGISIVHFGYLWAGYNFSVALAAKAAYPLQNRIGLSGVLLFIGLLPVVGYFGMGWTHGWAGVVLGFCFQVGRGLTQVSLRDALNQRVPSRQRATANSLVSLGIRLVFCVIGPFIGWSIDNKGIDTPIYALGAVYCLVFVFCLLPLWRKIQPA